VCFEKQPTIALITQFNETNIYIEAVDLDFSGILIVELCLDGVVSVKTLGSLIAVHVPYRSGFVLQL
jgi:hypothetical protein